VTVDNFSPPDDPSLLSSAPRECVNPLSRTLSWIYSDPDGDPQDKFQVQITTGGFSPPDFDSGEVGVAALPYKTPPAVLAPSTAYSWRVKVWDDRGEESNWSVPSPFTTVLHEYPNPNSFNWNPFFPLVNQVMTFDDWPLPGDPFDSPPASWSWDWFFDDGSPNSPASDPSHTYLTTGDYDVTLTLVDDLGVQCDATRQVKVIPPFPGWREISPF